MTYTTLRPLTPQPADGTLAYDAPSRRRWNRLALAALLLAFLSPLLLACEWALARAMILDGNLLFFTALASLTLPSLLTFITGVSASLQVVARRQHPANHAFAMSATLAAMAWPPFVIFYVITHAPTC